VSSRPYYSIGEVLGLLLEEFPDVTISKIRFLETQGLIDPERTPSGYRKFYDGDLERLRFILREQKDRYLPLRVIKERLDTSDETLPTTPRPMPSGASWASVPGPSVSGPSVHEREAVAAERANGSTALLTDGDIVSDPTPTSPIVIVEPVASPAEMALAPSAPAPVVLEATTQPRPVDHRRLRADELCAEAGIDAATLADLESFGLVTSKSMGGAAVYDADALEVARLAARLGQHGLEVRHLRTWKMSADKEISLFEQLVIPLVRQRNPQARHQASTIMEDLLSLGGALREAILRSSLQQYLER
jgi:DNA-binding transcriptional MerR regulator